MSPRGQLLRRKVFIQEPFVLKSILTQIVAQTLEEEIKQVGELKTMHQIVLGFHSLLSGDKSNWLHFFCKILYERLAIMTLLNRNTYFGIFICVGVLCDLNNPRYVP